MSQADFSWSTYLSRASRCSRDGNVEVAEKSSPSPKQPLMWLWRSHLSDSRAGPGHGTSFLTAEAVVAFIRGTWNLLEEPGKEKGNLLRVW